MRHHHYKKEELAQEAAPLHGHELQRPLVESTSNKISIRLEASDRPNLPSPTDPSVCTPKSPLSSAVQPTQHDEVDTHRAVVNDQSVYLFVRPPDAPSSTNREAEVAVAWTR